MARVKLSDIEIQRELGSLPGWVRKGDVLTKTWLFANFPAGIAFVDRVAVHAERANHHPDLDIRYTRVTAHLSTHDVGGITAGDIALAREMEKLAS